MFKSQDFMADNIFVGFSVEEHITARVTQSLIKSSDGICKFTKVQITHTECEK